MSDLKTRILVSKEQRDVIQRKFGFMPLSVLRLSRAGLSRRLFLYQAERPDRSGSAVKRMTGKEADERRKIGVIGGIMGGNKNTLAATTMPGELVEFFIKYYAQPGQIYLDPFMGQGVQMQVAKIFGLHYWGYDLSTEFFKYIRAVKSKIDDHKTDIKIFCADSRYPNKIPDDLGDFCFTSPPYWDIEFYGEESGQLGYHQSYPDFLLGMEEIARAWLPKFKSGAWCVINVNDFRKEGKFYPYHADTINLFCRAGWVLSDIWIIEGLVGGLPKAFGVEFNLRRIAPKVHEYAIVFKKS